MVDNIRFWFIVLCVIAAILFVGWKQPLRYRFLSAQEINLIENPEPPAPPPPPTLPTGKDNTWMFDPRRQTSLDRESYNPNGYRGSGTRTTIQGTQGTQGTIPYSR